MSRYAPSNRSRSPLVEDRIPEPELEPVLQHRGLTARVNYDLGADVATPVLVLNADPRGAIALEEHVDDVHAVKGLDAMFARVVEHHLIELAAHDLPGLRTLVRFVIPEVKRRRELAARVDELHAVLLDEMAPLHLRQHVEPLEHPVCLGMRDSPIWKRGNFSRSKSPTFRPCCARSVDVVDPAGPPPITTTS